MEAIVDGWFKPFVAMPYTNNLSYYSSPHLIRPLPPKAIPHIRPNLRCYKIVKYCSIVLLIKRDHPSYFKGHLFIAKERCYCMLNFQIKSGKNLKIKINILTVHVVKQVYIRSKIKILMLKFYIPGTFRCRKDRGKTSDH